MAKKQYYSVQRLGVNGEWNTLLSFTRVPRNEAMGGLRMADDFRPSSCYRVVEDNGDDVVVVKEGGGRGRISLGGCQTTQEVENIKHLFGSWQQSNRGKEPTHTLLWEAFKSGFFSANP